MDILKLITSQIGEGAISKLSELTGESRENTGKAIETVVPTLLNALNNNSNSEEGAAGILAALDRDHDGSILNDVMGFLNNGDNAAGNGILKHLLGDKRLAVENGLSMKSDVSSDSMSKIMTMLAPIIMGYLGKQKKENGVNSSGGISDLLTSIVGSLGNSGRKGLNIGDLLGMSGAGDGQQGQPAKGGLGSILGALGKFFGK